MSGTPVPREVLTARVTILVAIAKHVTCSDGDQSFAERVAQGVAGLLPVVLQNYVSQHRYDHPTVQYIYFYYCKTAFIMGIIFVVSPTFELRVLCAHPRIADLQ